MIPLPQLATINTTNNINSTNFNNNCMPPIAVSGMESFQNPQQNTFVSNNNNNTNNQNNVILLQLNDHSLTNALLLG